MSNMHIDEVTIWKPSDARLIKGTFLFTRQVKMTSRLNNHLLVAAAPFRGGHDVLWFLLIKDIPI